MLCGLLRPLLLPIQLPDLHSLDMCLNTFILFQKLSFIVIVIPARTSAANRFNGDQRYRARSSRITTCVREAQFPICWLFRCSYVMRLSHKLNSRLRPPLQQQQQQQGPAVTAAAVALLHLSSPQEATSLLPMSLHASHPHHQSSCIVPKVRTSASNWMLQAQSRPQGRSWHPMRGR